MIRKIKTALLGLGNVNRSLLNILAQKSETLKSQYNVEFLIVAVADSSGVAISEAGFLYSSLLELKEQKKKVRDLNGFIEDSSGERISSYTNCQLLIDASPVNLRDGSPGLSAIKNAIAGKCNVVMANKAPLVLAYDELTALSKKRGSKLAYSATVCGGLPVINLLTRDLKAAGLISLQGIFNATSNFVLQELAKGNTMESAIAEAQRIGAAETDPSLDLSGQDSANKLYIIMKSFGDFSGSIRDIQMTGIEAITPSQLHNAVTNGQTIKLIASATRIGESSKLSVQPTSVPINSFLGGINGWEMGIEIKTDLYESISMKNYEADPVGTAAGVLRDMIEVSG